MDYQKSLKGGHDGTVDYQVAPSGCPLCGSNADVRTARELFDTMTGARDQVFQRINQFRQPGSAPGQASSAPGQAGSAPGQWGSAPGQAGSAPGQAGSAPGQAGSAPGQAGSAPGQPGSAPGQPGSAPGSAPGQPTSEPGPWGPAPGLPGAAQGQRQGAGGADDDDYDHYNVESSDRQLRGNRGQRRPDFNFDSADNVIDDIGGAVLGAALGFAGRAIGRRMKKAFEERVIPAMEAKATQAQQQFEQSKAEQEAIVARYPELRGCTKDQVVFVEGGMRTVPLSEIKVPVTLAQADSIVARLR
jgi:hypothetical protein